MPTWEEVEKREFERWEGDVIRIETAGRSREECIEELKDELEKEIGYFA